MWSYYGSKSKIVHLYPPPKYGKIIEPFAGSARYSLKYWDRDVILIEKSKFIYEIWQYLKGASKKDIMNLPILKVGTDIRTLNFEGNELNFMRFFIGQGLPAPQWIVSSMCTEEKQIKTRSNVANSIHKIKDWTIINGDYKDIYNDECTWFIDPPYQFGGHKYLESNKKLDFVSLSEWCKSRAGQVIVCENTKASWMKFKPVISQMGSMFKTTEAIWSNLPTSYDMEQSSLFV